MHPAVRSHINGNLAIIRACIGQIEAAVTADAAGHPSDESLRAVRAEKEGAGNENVYLDDKAETVLEEGFAELWNQAQAEVKPDEPTIQVEQVQ